MRAYDAKLARQQERIALSPQMIAQRARLIAALAPSFGERILEVGCGNGHLTAELADMLGPSNVAAVDPSGDMVADTQSRAGVDAKIAGAAVLPYDDASFDALVAAQVYCFVDELGTAAAEAARVLRPGGRLVILDTDWSSLNWSALDKGVTGAMRRIFESHYAHADIPERLPRLLEAHGFHDVTVTPFTIEDDGAPNDYGTLAGTSSAQHLKGTQRASWDAAEGKRGRFTLRRMIVAARRAQHAARCD